MPIFNNILHGLFGVKRIYLVTTRVTYSTKDLRENIPNLLLSPTKMAANSFRYVNASLQHNKVIKKQTDTKRFKAFIFEVTRLKVSTTFIRSVCRYNNFI